jgi:hypothetical protein
MNALITNHENSKAKLSSILYLNIKLCILFLGPHHILASAFNPLHDRLDLYVSFSNMATK